MAITAFPFENQDTTETQYSDLFRELQDPGVIGSFGDTGLKVSADSTGMNVKVAIGSAFARGFVMQSDAIATLTVVAAEAGARVDRAIVRFDPATNGATMAVLKGSSGSPTPPVLTQTQTGLWEVSLGLIAVGAGVTAIAPAAITEDRTWVGGRVGCWSTTTRPATPRLARFGWNTTLTLWEFWNGTAWGPISATVDWATIGGKPATFPSAWATLTGIPATFAPDAHTHDDRYFTEAEVTALVNTKQPNLGFMPVYNSRPGGTASVGLGWDGDSPTIHVDVSTIQLATRALLSAVQSGLQGNIDNLWATRAFGWGGDLNVVRYSPGPTSGAYARNAGSNRFAVYMDDQLEWGRNVSSIRYKELVEDWAVDPGVFRALQTRTFRRKDYAAEGRNLGFIAEEVDAAGLTEAVIMDVRRTKDGVPYKNATPRIEGVDTGDAMTAALVSALQQVWDLVDTQADAIADLTARLDTLTATA